MFTSAPSEEHITTKNSMTAKTNSQVQITMAKFF